MSHEVLSFAHRARKRSSTATASGDAAHYVPSRLDSNPTSQTAFTQGMPSKADSTQFSLILPLIIAYVPRRLENHDVMSSFIQALASLVTPTVRRSCSDSQTALSSCNNFAAVGAVRQNHCSSNQSVHLCPIVGGVHCTSRNSILRRSHVCLSPTTFPALYKFSFALMRIVIATQHMTRVDKEAGRS